MDVRQYREFGKRMIDFTAEYHENIRDRSVVSSMEPGYLRQLLPSNAPDDPESFDQIMKDVDKYIMPGVTHWQHPNFYAYYPTAHSFAATCADILSDSIGCMGFTWKSCPVYTELEVIVLDWLVPLLGLPDTFLSSGKGGGVINSTASEATLTMMYAARSRILENLQRDNPAVDKYEVGSRLVAYYSEQAHSSVERACLIALVRARPIPTDENNGMCAEALEAAIREDIAQGLCPFYVCATLGTTNTCAFDPLDTVGVVCKRFGIWLHVDAAYAGSFFMCPETRHYLKGIDHVDSFNFNAHKALLVNFDCSIVWVTDRRYLIQSFEVNPLYLQHAYEGQMPDFRHWHLALGRRFRALKVWFVLRLYGVSGLQKHLRNHVERALQFKEYIEADECFELADEVRLGLVCFRVKSDNARTEALLHKINEDGRVHLVPGQMKDKYFLRLAIVFPQVSKDDISFAYEVMKELLDKV